VQRILLGAILITAVSTAVSVFVTRTLEPDTEAVLAEFEMAQDARAHFEQEFAVLIKTKDGAQSAVYKKLVKARPPAEEQYGAQEWARAEAAYTMLSKMLGEACLESQVSIRGICEAAGAGGAVHPTPVVSPPRSGVARTYLEQETPGHPVNTFRNFHRAIGIGSPIAAGRYVRVSCKVYDPTIASVNPDGYWYRIASSPWSNAYYSPANTFMNGDPYGGPYTHNTDFAVPNC
jgi:hypothetical protein